MALRLWTSQLLGKRIVADLVLTRSLVAALVCFSPRTWQLLGVLVGNAKSRIRRQGGSPRGSSEACPPALDAKHQTLIP